VRRQLSTGWRRPQIPGRGRATNLQRSVRRRGGPTRALCDRTLRVWAGAGRLELIEIAPGIDLQHDVLAHLGFTPIIEGEPKLMDERIFREEPMGLKGDLLTVPLEARFAYDAERDIFFLNMEGSLTWRVP